VRGEDAGGNGDRSFLVGGLGGEDGVRLVADVLDRDGKLVDAAVLAARLLDHPTVDGDFHRVGHGREFVLAVCVGIEVAVAVLVILRVSVPVDVFHEVNDTSLLFAGVPTVLTRGLLVAKSRLLVGLCARVPERDPIRHVLRLLKTDWRRVLTIVLGVVLKQVDAARLKGVEGIIRLAEHRQEGQLHSAAGDHIRARREGEFEGLSGLKGAPFRILLVHSALENPAFDEAFSRRIDGLDRDVEGRGRFADHHVHLRGTGRALVIRNRDRSAVCVAGIVLLEDRLPGVRRPISKFPFVGRNLPVRIGAPCRAEGSGQSTSGIERDVGGGGLIFLLAGSVAVTASQEQSQAGRKCDGEKRAMKSRMQSHSQIEKIRVQKRV
jgi:hypothetical protein